MAFSLPELAYAENALEPSIDATTMNIHRTKHHQAYINNLNKALEGHADLQAMSIEQICANIASMPDAIKGAVRNKGNGRRTERRTSGCDDCILRFIRCIQREICGCRRRPIRLRMGVALQECRWQRGDLFNSKSRQPTDEGHR